MRMLQKKYIGIVLLLLVAVSASAQKNVFTLQKKLLDILTVTSGCG